MKAVNVGWRYIEIDEGKLLLLYQAVAYQAACIIKVHSKSSCAHLLLHSLLWCDTSACRRAAMLAQCAVWVKLTGREGEEGEEVSRMHRRLNRVATVDSLP